MSTRPTRATWWLIPIALSFGALFALPPLREGMTQALAPESVPVDYLARAEARESDSNAWLAALALNPLAPVSEADLDHAYARAERGFPGSPAPHMLYADHLLGLPSEMPGPRGAKAEQALGKAGAVEPDNAAVEYLLASIAVSRDDEQQMAAHLRAALSKQSWDLHQAAAAKAAYQVARSGLPPAEALEITTQYVPTSLTRLSALATRTCEAADQAHQRGDLESAVMLRLSVLHLAELLLKHGYDIPDGLVGIIIWQRASEAELSPAEVSKAEQEASTEADKERAVQVASRRKLMMRLRGGGETEVAAAIEAFADTADEGFDRLLARQLMGAAHHHHASALVFQIAESTHAAMGALIFLLLFGVAAFAVRLRGRSVDPIRQPWWGWGLVLVASAGASAAAAVSPAWRAGEIGTSNMWVLAPWGRSAALVGLPLLALLALVIGVVHLRRAGEQTTERRGGGYVGTMIALLLPVTAVLCLVALGTAVAGAKANARLDQVNQAILEQGEMGHHGLRAK